MSARDIVETATNMIISQIQTALPTALAAVSTERGDDEVALGIPDSNSYFFYSGAKAFRAPAVFVVPNGVDFHLERGQNFVDSTIAYVVSVVVEERRQNLLSPKAWRYQDALHSCLQGIELVSPSNKIKIVILVNRARFSEDMSVKDNGSDVFRKEVAFDCGVEIYENL